LLEFKDIFIILLKYKLILIKLKLKIFIRNCKDIIKLINLNLLKNKWGFSLLSLVSFRLPRMSENRRDINHQGVLLIKLNLILDYRRLLFRKHKHQKNHWLLLKCPFMLRHQLIILQIYNQLMVILVHTNQISQLNAILIHKTYNLLNVCFISLYNHQIL
jgi:hypothetical protein